MTIGMRGTPGIVLSNNRTGQTVQWQGNLPLENVKTVIESLPTK